MSFPDTGPQADGTRTAEQWLNAMGEDMGVIRMQLKDTVEHGDQLTREDIARNIAIAQKEATRLHSDIRRFAEEVHGITREDLDKVGPL